jgi:hypothetical protein
MSVHTMNSEQDTIPLIKHLEKMLMQQEHEPQIAVIKEEVYGKTVYTLKSVASRSDYAPGFFKQFVEDFVQDFEREKPKARYDFTEVAIEPYLIEFNPTLSELVHYRQMCTGNTVRNTLDTLDYLKRKINNQENTEYAMQCITTIINEGVNYASRKKGYTAIHTPSFVLKNLDVLGLSNEEYKSMVFNHIEKSSNLQEVSKEANLAMANKIMHAEEDRKKLVSLLKIKMDTTSPCFIEDEKPVTVIHLNAMSNVYQYKFDKFNHLERYVELVIGLMNQHANELELSSINVLIKNENNPMLGNKIMVMAQSFNDEPARTQKCVEVLDKALSLFSTNLKVKCPKLDVSDFKSHNLGFTMGNLILNLKLSETLLDNDAQYTQSEMENKPNHGKIKI